MNILDQLADYARFRVKEAEKKIRDLEQQAEDARATLESAKRAQEAAEKSQQRFDALVRQDLDRYRSQKFMKGRSLGFGYGREGCEWADEYLGGIEHLLYVCVACIFVA